MGGGRKRDGSTARRHRDAREHSRRPGARHRPSAPGPAGPAPPAPGGFWELGRWAAGGGGGAQPGPFAPGGGVKGGALPPGGAGFFGWMIVMDPPRHTKLRKLVSWGFTPRVIRQLEEAVRVQARRIVDAVAPKGACDFVEEIAAALPLRIICDMMGIPEADHRRIFELTNVILGVGDPEYATSQEGHPHAERPRGLRRRWPALLPRRQSRPTRDPRDVRGALPPASRHPRDRAARHAGVVLHPRHQAHAGGLHAPEAGGVSEEATPRRRRR